MAATWAAWKIYKKLAWCVKKYLCMRAIRWHVIGQDYFWHVLSTICGETGEVISKLVEIVVWGLKTMMSCNNNKSGIEHQRNYLCNFISHLMRHLYFNTVNVFYRMIKSEFHVMHMKHTMNVEICVFFLFLLTRYLISSRKGYRRV